MGAIEERNNLIDCALVKYKICHDKHFPVGRSLTDSEWQQYIEDMDSISSEYKDTTISDLSGQIYMAFLNDVEFVHKKWVEKENK